MPGRERERATDSERFSEMRLVPPSPSYGAFTACIYLLTPRAQAPRKQVQGRGHPDTRDLPVDHPQPTGVPGSKMKGNPTRDSNTRYRNPSFYYIGTYTLGSFGQIQGPPYDRNHSGMIWGLGLGPGIL